jgi:SPASM domain peptide maturase of grasp-with-spasm system
MIAHSINDISKNSFCGTIHPNSFVQNISFFTESLSFNTCLNRKIVIDEKGEIKNCPSMSESFGNVNENSIKSIIETPEFQKKWFIKKDDIKVCSDCEFRYMCLDCRAFLNNDELFHQPAKCGYNPYIAKWKGQEGYIPVMEMNKQKTNK